MTHYRWDGDGPFRDGRNDRIVEPGETVELDEHVGGPNDELVRVDEDELPSEDDGEPDADSAEPDDVEGEVGTLPFSPEHYSIPELEDRLQDVDDPAAVAALRSLEQEQEARKGADAAFEERLDELEG